MTNSKEEDEGGSDGTLWGIMYQVFKDTICSKALLSPSTVQHCLKVSPESESKEDDIKTIREEGLGRTKVLLAN